MYGVRAMAIVSYVAIPLMAVLMVIVMVMAIKRPGSIDAIRAIKPSSSMTVTSAITVIVGTFASGGTPAGNSARCAKTGKTAFIAGLFGFLIGNGVMIFSGMLGGLVFGTGDLIELMISMGDRILGTDYPHPEHLDHEQCDCICLRVWLEQELFHKNNKKPFIIGGILIALLMAILGISNYFIPMLNLLGTFVPPLGGAIIGDYFFVSKGRIPKLEYVTFKTWRVAPIIAYILGCAAAYFGGLFNFGMPALQGILVAMITMPIIHAIFVKCGLNDEHEVAENAEYI